MIDLELERKDFEKSAFDASGGWASFEKDSNGKYWPDKLNLAWDMWVKRAEKENEEIDSLKAQLNKLDDGWVSVLVKEPPIDQTVLICWSDSPDVEPEKDYMTVDEDLNHYWANFHKDNPSHWMLLPKTVNENSHE